MLCCLLPTSQHARHCRAGRFGRGPLPHPGSCIAFDLVARFAPSALLSAASQPEWLESVNFNNHTFDDLISVLTDEADFPQCGAWTVSALAPSCVVLPTIVWDRESRCPLAGLRGRPPPALLRSLATCTCTGCSLVLAVFLAPRQSSVCPLPLLRSSARLSAAPEPNPH